ncbi:class I SAM-dependent methyltransferase [Anabaena sp. WFMT]|uniref:class I SAM-dependent methyltransferase n=1 Tax=Anabaena sp. WFMT TaxID=3449730 RepID=UPI003F29E813
MSEQQPETIQQKIKQLATQAIKQSKPSSWFEVLYAESQGDATQVPWANLTPHPYLQNWLNTHPQTREKPSALVIGCGLGDDAEALAKHEFQVTAFDISPTAVTWCQQRFPNSAVTYIVADLFAIPIQWQQAFDLVFECRNIQALPLNVRSLVIESVASMVAVGGTLLIITGFRETEAEPDGPPWSVSESELTQFTAWGLTEISRFPFLESNKQRLRIEYRRELSTK